jgi:two-component system sensor histidine kinase TtrS
VRVLLSKALISIVMLLGLGSASGAEGTLKIGILSFDSKTDTASRWQPTADHLQTVIAQQRFSIVPLNYDELNAAVESGAVDFVLTNPEHYVVLRNVFRLSPMVTLNTLINNKAVSTFGSVIFTRKDARDVLDLRDVAGRRVAAVGL